MRADSVLKISRVALFVFLALLPVFLYWATQLKMGTTVVDSWLPGDDQARQSYLSFREQFGEDQYLLLSWKSCRLGDDRLELFSQALETESKERPQLQIAEVSNSSRVLDELTKNQIPLAVAKRRLLGILLGPNDEALIQVRLERGEVSSRSELISRVRALAAEILRQEANQLVLAGEPFQVQEIDRSTRETLSWFVPPSMLLTLLMAWMCVRNIPMTLTVMAYAGIGQLIGMSVISFFLGEMIAVLVVLPTLVFMLTLSAAVHLASYHRDASQAKETPEGVVALQRGLHPCVLATVTTVFGFGSLIVSQLAPVWQFGAISAGSLLIASCITLTTFPIAAQLPTLLRKWIFGGAGSDDSNANPPTNPAPSAVLLDTKSSKAGSSLEETLIRNVAGFTAHWSTLLVILGVALLLFSFVGIGKLRSSTEFEDMFAADSEAVEGLYWVRDHIGPINALEFLLEFSDAAGQPLSVTEQLIALEQFSVSLSGAPQIQAAMSALTFLPAVPEGRGTRSTIARAVFQRKVEANLPILAEKGLLSQGPSGSRWRLTARVSDLRGDNYGMVRERITGVLNECAAKLSEERPGFEAKVELTGLRAVVEKAHYALISDLAFSFVAAFALITPVMMLIVRGVLSGLVLMIPNILPVAFVFGCMGWCGVTLDVASILTASVALGIAVDDTLHFVTWYFRGRREGMDATQATRRAIETCSRPIVHTTLICTAAMSPFFLSEFLPTSKFAALMVLILLGAIVGDLLLLPALLQSPFGRWIGDSSDSLSERSTGSSEQVDSHG